MYIYIHKYIYIHIYIYTYIGRQTTKQSRGVGSGASEAQREGERANSQAKDEGRITGMLCTTQSSQNSGATARKHDSQRHSKRNNQNDPMISLRKGPREVPETPWGRPLRRVTTNQLRSENGAPQSRLLDRPGAFWAAISRYIYIYIYIYIHNYTCIYIYIYMVHIHIYIYICI